MTAFDSEAVPTVDGMTAVYQTEDGTTVFRAVNRHYPVMAVPVTAKDIVVDRPEPGQPRTVSYEDVKEGNLLIPGLAEAVAYMCLANPSRAGFTETGTDITLPIKDGNGNFLGNLSVRLSVSLCSGSGEPRLTMGEAFNNVCGSEVVYQD